MLAAALTFFLLHSLCYAVNLTFFEGKGCSEQPLYIVDSFAFGQHVYFYADTDCQQEVYNTGSDVCYLHANTNVAAIRVASPEHRTSVADVSTTELVPYVMQDLSGNTDVSSFQRIPLSDFFIAYALDIGAGTITFGLLGLSCYAATDGSALSITGCILRPIATGLSFAAGYFKGRAGATMRAQANVRTGTISNINTPRKRDLIDAVNFDYLSDAMNLTGASGSHVGLMNHDLGNGEQTSPVYEVTAEDGRPYHIAAFYSEESDAFIHRIYEAQHAVLNKRAGPGYLGVRWNKGGYDLAICNYNAAADTSDFDNKDLNDLYNQTSIYFEILNGNRNLIAGIEIVPFSGQSGGAISPLRCSKATTQNQACVN
ncbi:hypothetical protein KC354_g9267 [Hortaea werneckii]|nr:hypothetical protein KC354_g9267 [Hortaea werneckii]